MMDTDTDVDIYINIYICICVCVYILLVSFLFIIVIDQKQFIEPFVLIGVATLALSRSLTSFFTAASY